MSILSKVDSFNTGTGVATSTVVVTGVGFTPEAVIFWHSGRSESTDTIGRASHYRGFGVAVSATDRRAITSSSIDALIAADTQAGQDEAACILSIDATPAIDGALDLQSFDADGFTLVVDDQMPRDLRVHFMALAGGITNAISGRFTEPGAIGDQDVTGLGFQPDFVLFFSAGMAANPPGAKSDSDLMIGAATGSSNQGVWSGGSNNGSVTMQAMSYCTSGECIAFFESTIASIASRADFVSFLADGFRVNWAERSSGRRIHYLALKGDNYRVDSLLTQTDTVTDIAESGFGFSPSAALFVSHGQAESTSDTAQDHDRLSIGAFSSLTDRGAQATLDEDATADSEVTTAIELDAIYANISTGSAIDGLMDIKSRDSDGFTAIMDDADPAQAFVWYMAFGPAAAGAALTVSVSETITLSEATALNLVSFVNASETVTLSEAATLNLVSLISASETVTLSEAVNALLVSLISASETVTLTEVVTVVVSNPQVSASETVTLTEATTTLLASHVSTSDTITLTENAALVMADLRVSAAETVTLSETVGETLVYQVSAAETITLTEGATSDLVSFISTDETITLTESTTENLVALVTAAETITLTESTTEKLDFLVSAADTVTLSESATATTSAPQVLAAETVTLNEMRSVTIVAEGVYSVATNDDIILSETVTVVMSDLQVVAGETVTLAEARAANLIISISASEMVTLTETVSQIIPIVVAASEDITLSESLTVAPLLLAGVNVAETITLTESVSLVGVAVVAVVGTVMGVRTTGTVIGVRTTGTLRG